MATVLAIREAAIGDVDTVVRVINSAFEVERFFIERHRTDASSVASMMSTGTFLLGEDPADGCAVAAVYTERRSDHGYFGVLAVVPDRKRQGFGRQMIGAVEARFRALGCVAVDMRVVSVRTELPAIYRGWGYEEIGTEPFDDPRLLEPCHFITMSKPL